MTVQERVRAEEQAVLALIREAGRRVPIEGDRAGWADASPSGRGIRLPAPSELVRDGRRVRARRRIVRGTAGLAACALVAAGGVALGSGTLRLPGLDRWPDGAWPAALTANRGTDVGDVVNAIDTGLGGSFGVDTTERQILRYRARAGTPTMQFGGSDRAADRLAALREAGVDRGIEVRQGAGEDGVVLRLLRTRPGTTEVVGARDLPALDRGADGRGRWLRVRPSAEDGWLILANLPVDPVAGAVQVRVAGTDVVLPVETPVTYVDLECVQVSLDGDAVATAESVCRTKPPSLSVAVRIATTADTPPIDAITYVDEHGRYVVLDETSAQTIVD